MSTKKAVTIQTKKEGYYTVGVNLFSDTGNIILDQHDDAVLIASDQLPEFIDLLNEHRKQPRFCLIQDNDSHWYLCPAERRQEADALFQNPDFEGDTPPWLEALGGGPGLITFTDPSYTR